MSVELSSAAWFPDPTGRRDQRYWDGAQWTDLVASAAGGQAEHDPIAPDETLTPPGSAPAPDATPTPTPTSTPTPTEISDTRPASWTGQPSPVVVYATVGPKTNGLAVAALVLGVLPLAGVGSILAIVLGHIARRQIDTSNGAQTGREMATAGFVLGFIWLAVTAIAIIALATG